MRLMVKFDAGERAARESFADSNRD